MSSEHPPGYHVPLFRALHEPILLGGAPRDAVIWLWVCALALGAKFGMKPLLFLLVAAAIVHVAMAIGTKHDPHFVHVLSRYFRSPPRLDP